MGQRSESDNFGTSPSLDRRSADSSSAKKPWLTPAAEVIEVAQVTQTNISAAGNDLSLCHS
jgi:hypothetical protein